MFSKILLVATAMTFALLGSASVSAHEKSISLRLPHLSLSYSDHRGPKRYYKRKDRRHYYDQDYYNPYRPYYGNSKRYWNPKKAYRSNRPYRFGYRDGYSDYYPNKKVYRLPKRSERCYRRGRYLYCD